MPPISPNATAKYGINSSTIEISAYHIKNYKSKFAKYCYLCSLLVFPTNWHKNMKKIIVILSLIVLFGFADIVSAKPGAIDSIFRSHKLRGSFLMLDYSANKFTVYNDARCRRRISPASTFKMPNTLIALELGIVKDTNHLFKWDGTPRRMDIWNKDMNLAEAMRVSCVPCYQEIATQIGSERMQQWLDKFNYGNKCIGDSSHIDKFWLNDSLKISQYEQIDFLKKIYFSNISAKKKNIDILKSIIIKEQNDKYTISGKTGTSIQKKLTGWYVGYVENSGKVYFFATSIEANIPKEGLLTQERIDLTYDILRHLKVID